MAILFQADSDINQRIADQTSPGVLIIPQDIPIGVAIEELLMIWATSEAHEWKNRLDFIPI